MMFRATRNSMLVLLGLIAAGSLLTAEATTAVPTSVPTSAPTNAPVTDAPTAAPTNAPVTDAPTAAPTNAQTPAPTNAVTDAPTPAPTNAAGNPTPAPTNAESGPTSAPSSAPTSAPVTDTNPASPTAAPTTSTTGSTTAAANTDGSTTGAANTDAPKITFDTKLTVSKATDFDRAAFLESIAESSGVPAGNVVVKSVSFEVAVSYSFAEDVTEDEVKAGAATSFGVAEDKIEVTLTPARRLLGVNGRRLAVTADVKVTTDDAATADTISTNMAAATGLSDAISAATGKTITAPTVTAAPVMDVVVVTEVTSTNDEVPAAPTAEDLKTKMETKTGKTFTVTVSEPVVTNNAAPAESSGACSYKAISAVVAMVLSSVYLN